MLKIVLVNTSHPGNIGAAARAMKVMGLTDLVLVEPKLFPSQEASARSTGAEDILQQAVVVASLPDAISDCGLVLGTSARARSMSWPQMHPEAAACHAVQAEQSTHVAIVFGCERDGLSNAQLQMCHYHVTIPTSGNFHSLNLASAVQIIAYEVLKARANKLPDAEVADQDDSEALATGQQVQGLFQHLETTLTAIRFLNAEHPKGLMSRLCRLFMRAKLSAVEVNILRGMLTSIDRKNRQCD